MASKSFERLEDIPKELLNECVSGMKKRKALFVFLLFVTTLLIGVASYLLSSVNMIILFAVSAILGVLQGALAGFVLAGGAMIVAIQSNGAHGPRWIFYIFYCLWGGIVIPLIVYFICLKKAPAGILGYKKAIEKYYN